MHPRARKRIFLVTFLLITVLIGMPVWSVYRQVRQERLNRDLIAAIKKNNTAAAIALLNAGADANALDHGKVPFSASQQLIAWLYRLRGRKATATFSVYPSALMAASLIYDRKDSKVTPPENIAIIQALLDHGANPNADYYGDHVLILAVYDGHTATARLLLDHGADVNARNPDGSTAVIYAYRDRPIGMIELLVDRSADVNTRDRQGNTVLMTACYAGDLAGVKRLLQAGAIVNAKNINGDTALLFAASYNHTPVLRLLLEHGADVNVRNKDGETALIYAADQSNPANIKLLLAHGADVTIKDQDGYTALMLAKHFGHADIVCLLKQAGAKE
jgi:ankyrin repeat protein